VPSNSQITLIKSFTIIGLIISFIGIILAMVIPSLGIYVFIFSLLPSVCALLSLFIVQQQLGENQIIVNKQIAVENQLQTNNDLISQQNSIVENQRLEISNLKDELNKQVIEFAVVNSHIQSHSKTIQNQGNELVNFQASLKEQNNLINLAQAGINEQNGNYVLVKSNFKEQGILMDVLKSDISEVKVKQNDQNLKLSNLSTNLKESGKEIISVQADVKLNQNTLKENSKNILQHSNRIAGHQNEIEVFKKENLGQSLKLDKQESEITNLFSQLKSEGAKINSNHGILDAHQLQLNTCSGNISTIQTNINLQQSVIEKQQIELISLQKNFKIQFDEVSNQNQQVQDRINNIGKNQHDLTSKIVNQYNSLQSITTDLTEQRGALQEHTSYLKNTQEELASQRDKFKEQNSAWSHQTFDNTFFKFLENHNTMVSTMELFTSGKGQKVSLAQGKGCFTFFHKKLAKKVAEYTEYTIQNTLAAYNVFYRDYKIELDPYFKNIYQVLKFVQESEIKEINKERYSHFVRAQFSAHELNLVYYHGLSLHAEKDLKEFLEKYAMFKNLDTGLLFSKSHSSEYQTQGVGQSLSGK